MSNKQSNLIHYDVKGQGDKTVLLINGLARSSRHWLEFPEELVSLGYKVITVDNRGFGRSKHIGLSPRSTVTEFAQDIVMVLEKECLSSLHVIGLSLGGMIAMELAGLMPTQVLSLTIVNSSAAKTHPLRLSPAGMLKLGKMGIQRSPEKRTEVELTALTTLDQSSARYQSVFDSFVTFEKTEPVDAKNVALQLKAAIGFELEPIKKNITMPLLVLYSSKDAFVPNKNSLGLQQQLPHATLRCIEGKGHELMVEDPQGVAHIFDKHATSKQ